jgi:CRP/FNR family transcriptional regulator, dissimilatory nitrate respiration regulator
MTPISFDKHPERNVIRLELRQNVILKEMTDGERNELERHLIVVDCNKGDYLLHQGVHEMEQYFVLDGILKRVVTNADAKEMILRFADQRDMETSYAAWRLNTPTPYSIICVTKARVAKLPMPTWVAFLDQHPKFKATFEYQVMRLMSEIMGHTITLHLLDGPGRVHRFEPGRTNSEEGTGRPPQPLGRDAEPAEAARQDLSGSRRQAAMVRSMRHELCT